MSWKKFAPVAVVVLMALPVVVMVTPAAHAQDTVPIAPSIRWENQNQQQLLYVTYPDVRDVVFGTQAPNKPDCTQTEASQFPTTLSLRQNENEVDNPRPPCTYAAAVAGSTAPAQGIASFALAQSLLTSFNVTGNNSLRYYHLGTIPSGVQLTVTLRSGAATVSTLTIQGNSGASDFSGDFKLSATSAYEFKRGDKISLTLSGAVGGSDTGAPTGAPSWTIYDSGSRLELRSADALKAATWTQDETGAVRSLFRPLDRNLTTRARLVGVFAVQSAFSIEDARGFQEVTDIVPRFAMERGGRLIPLGPQGATTLDGEFNRSLSQDTAGRAVWNFPTGFLDYRGFDAGEYNLTVDMPYHQGGAFRNGIVSRVLLTTQSVALTPYDDVDPTTSPSPLETNAHDLASGGSTTYLFLINNTGAVNDTFRIDSTFISGAPAGWAATIGGPGITEGRVRLAPRESKLVTMTVTAPPGASTGASSIFQLQAVSLLDTSAKSIATTVVSTVTNAITREVRVISPPGDVPIVPGEDTHIPVYVWNRGTRFATIALEVQGSILQDWSILIAQGDSTVPRLVLPSVPAGGIVQAELRITAPTSQAEGTQDVILNATQTDVGGIATNQPLHLVIRQISGVKVEILDSITGTGHIAELTGNFTFVPGTQAGEGQPVADPLCDNRDTAGRGTACYDDGIDGIWFRVWVTNTGKRTEVFALTFDSKLRSSCDQAFVGEPVLYFRDAKGAVSGRDTILLKAGQTGEVYVWRPIDRKRNDCGDGNEDSYVFVVNARGRDTGVIGRDGARVLAVDNGGSGYTSPVLLEHVARREGYSAEAPYVDIQNATKRTITAGVEVNTTRSYFVRLTHAAAWSTYTDTLTGKTFRPEVRVAIAGVDTPAGWNVSMRRADGDLNTVTNPWLDSLTFLNQYPTAIASMQRQGWTDYELEVRVESPHGQNGTGLAGEQDQFTVQATIADKISTLEFKAVVTEFANLSLEADSLTVFAHPGSAGAALVYVNNTGSSDAIVALRATVDTQTTPNAAAWTVEPASQTFILPAFRNRTTALLVTPPGGAAAGEIIVTAEYAPNPFEPARTVNKTMRLSTQVVPRGSITLGATSTAVTIAPGGFANYTLSLVNSGSVPTPYRVSATSIPNWTATLSPLEGTLASGEVKQIVYVLKAPTDVTNGAGFSSVVKVEEIGNPSNFDIRPVTVNILGGKALPSVSVPKVQKTVDRSGVTLFEVAVKNLGSAAGRIDLTARSADPNWQVAVQSLRGDAITSIQLSPNDLVVVNVSVRAPFTVAENTLVPIEFIAESGGVAAKATLQAIIHDYGVALSLNPTRVDAIVGIPAEFVITLRNTGNDNDTVNVSANLVDIPEWRVDLSLERVRLEPGQSTDVRAVVRQPAAPLPTPRAYTLKFFAGTVGGVAVNIPKNDSVAAVVNILNYRPMDVDRDDFLEVAVDYDKNPDNGFERFQEIFPEGIQSIMVANGRLDGKARFFLDVPRDRPIDGVADVWFDPETVYAYEIKNAPDLNNDNAPDYLLDSNRDGKIDRAFDTVSQTYWSVTEIKAYGDERIQYLVELNNDARPDRFYDPETKLVTRTQNVDGEVGVVGLDTDNDGRIDKVYDVKASTVTDARLTSASNFFVKYWYFFVGFAVLILVSILLVVRRKR